MSSTIKPILAFVLLCASSFAMATTTPAALPNPIRDVTPYPGDEINVIAFFKYTCPICRNYQAQLNYWGNTLPKQLKMQFVPVVEGNSAGQISIGSIEAATMFWSVDGASKNAQREAFSAAAYDISQDKSLQNTPADWMNALKNAHIPQNKFLASWNYEKDNWQNRMARQSHYKPTATPTLVICGKWMITPDSVSGNEEMFMQLANGLVSKCLNENGIADKK